MAMDDDDDTVSEADPSAFEDPIAQRTSAFVQLAMCADNVKDETVRDLCRTMLRKVSASIRTPSTAEVKVLDGGKTSN